MKKIKYPTNEEIIVETPSLSDEECVDKPKDKTVRKIIKEIIKG